MLARRRAFALAAMLVFVWCQIVAVTHASTMPAADLAGSHAAEMAGMVGCDGLPDTDSDGDSDCPTEDATSDVSKLPLSLPLPPAAPFALVVARDQCPCGMARYELPQGRAPPRSRLCSWLI